MFEFMLSASMSTWIPTISISLIITPNPTAIIAWNNHNKIYHIKRVDVHIYVDWAGPMEDPRSRINGNYRRWFVSDLDNRFIWHLYLLRRHPYRAPDGFKYFWVCLLLPISLYRTELSVTGSESCLLRALKSLLMKYSALTQVLVSLLFTNMT